MGLAFGYAESGNRSERRSPGQAWATANPAPAPFSPPAMDIECALPPSGTSGSTYAVTGAKRLTGRIAAEKIKLMAVPRPPHGAVERLLALGDASGTIS